MSHGLDPDGLGRCQFGQSIFEVLQLMNSLIFDTVNHHMLLGFRVRVQGLETLNPKMYQIGNALVIGTHSMSLLMNICY